MQPLKPKPKAVIFDCWNTLFYVESQPTMMNRLAVSLTNRKLSYGLMKRIEKSLMMAPEKDPEAAARKLLKDLHLPASFGLVQRAVSIINSPDRHHQAYVDSMPVVEELAKRYKLGMITNTYEIAFRDLEREFNLNKHFDVIITSYEAGLIKPDPKIFHEATKRLGAQPSETVMVGDSYRDDVQAAEAEGLTGILIDRRGKQPNFPRRITELNQLLKIL